MKLVRDNIPQIAPEREFYIAEGEELSQFVTNKILEEAKEVCEAPLRSDKIEELADLYEVMCKYIEVHNITWDEVHKAREVKGLIKGAFHKNVILK